MIKIGSYVRLCPPAGMMGTNGVGLHTWQDIFRRNGGKCLVLPTSNNSAYHIHDVLQGRWAISVTWVKLAELTVNKLGNFPRKGEVEL